MTSVPPKVIPVGTPVIVGAGARVRPARLDVPLRRSALGPAYADPVLENLVAGAAERAREDARAQGYAAGWSQGRQAAAAEAAEQARTGQLREQQQRDAETARMTGLLARLADAARGMRSAQTIELTDVATALADAAVELAAAVLDRELTTVDDALRRQVLAALTRIADPDAAVVHLNPADAGRLTELPGGVRVIPDAAVPTGEVVVLTPAQRLRLDIPAALAAARQVLAG